MSNCEARTKAGTRCKRKATTNTTCHQHRDRVVVEVEAQDVSNLNHNELMGYIELLVAQYAARTGDRKVVNAENTAIRKSNNARKSVDDLRRLSESIWNDIQGEKEEKMEHGKMTEAPLPNKEVVKWVTTDPNKANYLSKFAVVVEGNHLHFLVSKEDARAAWEEIKSQVPVSTKTVSFEPERFRCQGHSNGTCYDGHWAYWDPQKGIVPTKRADARCAGKGWQSEADRRRNYGYDNYNGARMS